MDPLTWALIIGATGALIGGVSSAVQAEEKNEAISNVQTQYTKQLRAQRALLAEQARQLRDQAQQAKTERLTQLYKQLGAQAAWAAAQGLQGGSFKRLQMVERADAAKDISIIDINLRNYLKQLSAEEKALKAGVDIQIAQLGAQKIDPFWAGLSGAISGFSTGAELGYSWGPEIGKLFQI